MFFPSLFRGGLGHLSIPLNTANECLHGGRVVSVDTLLVMVSRLGWGSRFKSDPRWNAVGSFVKQRCRENTVWGLATEKWSRDWQPPWRNFYWQPLGGSIFVLRPIARVIPDDFGNARTLLAAQLSASEAQMFVNTRLLVIISRVNLF